MCYAGWWHECSQEINIIQAVRVCKVLFQVTASTLFQLTCTLIRIYVVCRLQHTSAAVSKPSESGINLLLCMLHAVSYVYRYREQRWRTKDTFSAKNVNCVILVSLAIVCKLLEINWAMRVPAYVDGHTDLCENCIFGVHVDSLRCLNWIVSIAM